MSPSGHRIRRVEVRPGMTFKENQRSNDHNDLFLSFLGIGSLIFLGTWRVKFKGEAIKEHEKRSLGSLDRCLRLCRSFPASLDYDHFLHRRFGFLQISILTFLTLGFQILAGIQAGAPLGLSTCTLSPVKNVYFLFI